MLQEEAQEESGWKLVHGDVFRPPEFSPMLLSVLAGEWKETLSQSPHDESQPHDRSFFPLLVPFNRFRSSGVWHDSLHSIFRHAWLHEPSQPWWTTDICAAALRLYG